MRVVSAVLAVTYALTFVVVCLGGCLAPATGASHPCCAEGPGLGAPSVDCCKVVSSVRGPSLTVVETPAVTTAPIWPTIAFFRAPAVHDTVSPLSPSPPLILRI